MSILKYYKVDSDGKIKRLRRECPTAECGAGIFVRTFFHSTYVLALICYFCRWLSTRTVSTAASVASPTLSLRAPSPLSKVVLDSHTYAMYCMYRICYAHPIPAS
jgi:ribosomal protein S27AE